MAIILDGHLKSALAAVRSLGAKNVRTVVGAQRSTAMARHSRFATGSFTYPSPYDDREGFVCEILAQLQACDTKPVLFTFSDATHLLLEAHREEIAQHAYFPLPQHEAVVTAFDKEETQVLARKLQVPTIPTRTVDEAAHTHAYPIVIKTRHSATWKEGRGVFGTAEFVFSEEALRKRHQGLKEETGEAPLVQEFVYGDEYGVEMLAQNGNTCARATHKRLRSLSPTGGASVLKEIAERSEITTRMEDYAERVVRELSWSGPMMVEFKVDEKDGEPKLVELNGRFWGSLQLPITAGVDFPYLYYQLARGEYKGTHVVEPGVRAVTQHYLGDVVHVLRVWFSRDPMRPILYPSRMRALRDFLLLPRGTKQDVWALYDIKPGIMEYIDVIRSRI